jgi:hypothetical protein
MRRIIVLLATFVTIHASRADAQSDTARKCFFSSPAKSSVAWESLFSRDTLKGRVVRVRDLGPVTFGVVRLEPGNAYAVLDSAGSFRFSRVHPGRYFVRVQAGGYPEATDSITVGQDGLFILASVGAYRGDIVITCPQPAASRKPSNQR